MTVLGRIAHVGLRLGALAAAEQAPAAAAMVAVVITVVGLRLLLRRGTLAVQVALRRAGRGGSAGFVFFDPRVDDGVQGARLLLGDADHRLGARLRLAGGRGLKGRHDRRRLDARLGRARRLGANRLAIGFARRLRGARHLGAVLAAGRATRLMAGQGRGSRSLRGDRLDAAHPRPRPCRWRPRRRGSCHPAPDRRPRRR